MENQKNISLNQLFEKLRAMLKKILSLAGISVIVTFVGAVIGVIQLCRPDYSKLTSELLKTAIADFKEMPTLHIPEEYLDDDVVKNIKAYIDINEAFQTSISLLEFSPLNNDEDILELLYIFQSRLAAIVFFNNLSQNMVARAQLITSSLPMLDSSIMYQTHEAQRKYNEILSVSDAMLEHLKKDFKDGVSKKEKRKLTKCINAVVGSEDFYNWINSYYIFSKNLYKSCKLKIQLIVSGNEQEHSSPELNI